jgi:hypothetical protein
MKEMSSQADVIAFLRSPATHAGAEVESIETPASMVFLAGDRAWKLKRAVRDDCLDFSTVERRRLMCEAELRINRRAAPALYQRVVAVTREPDGSLALGGGGQPVDWLIEMARFAQERLFDRLAQRAVLDVALMPPLASAIARFHATADRRADHGGRDGMQRVIDGNALAFAQPGAGVLDPAACAAVTERVRAALARHALLLDTRRSAGRVRQCHGDLHLRNIVLLDGVPTLFDAVEFNNDVACIDVWYDVAFLVMDLWRRRLRTHANALFNAYVFETNDYGGLPLLPLFLSCRAAVRARTSVTAAHLQRDMRRRRELQQTAVDYLQLAGELLHIPRAAVVAVGGFSDSGKSTLARAVAPDLGAVPGAVVIRSDEVRRQLCGAAPMQRLDATAYSSEMTARVYATIIDRALTVARAGHSAIVDAVFARVADRAAIERAASSAGLPFTGIWLDSPATVMAGRLGRRDADASDAEAAILRRQIAAGTGGIEWRRVDAARHAAVLREP